MDQTTDQIEHALFSSLMEGNGAVPASGATPDLLTSNAWEEVIVGVYAYHYIYIYPLKHTHMYLSKWFLIGTKYAAGFSKRYTSYTSGVQVIVDAVQSRHKVYNKPGYICSGTLSCIALYFLINLSVRTFSVYDNKFLCFLNLIGTETNIYMECTSTVFKKCMICFICQPKFLLVESSLAFKHVILGVFLRALLGKLKGLLK